MYALKSYGCLFLLVFSCWSTQELQAQVNHKNFREAMAAGGKLLRERNLAGSIPHFEAALALADKPEDQINAYEALMGPYRELTDTEKMTVACEFIIQHSNSRTKRDTVGKSLAIFYANRGSVEKRLAEYEQKLEASPEDRVALNMAWQLASLNRANKAKADALKVNLDALNQSLAKAKAEALETLARQSPDLQAWNWKEAGLAWVEANDIPKALAAAEQSLASPAENRNDLLVHYWRMHLGDIFAAAQAIPQAKQQYELSIAAAGSEPLKKAPQDKLKALP